jgi:hypothetical protein
VSFQPPAFIAFTGVDRVAISDALLALSSRYPIEWGILVDDDTAAGGSPLFPAAPVREQLLSSTRVRWAAHVCGAQAKRIVTDPAAVQLNLAGYQRAQINHSFAGSSAVEAENTSAFGRRRGIRTVLQCSNEFPQEQGVDWLFDVSFGKGATPGHWPSLPAAGPFCGFSGGLRADNVRDVLARIAAPAGALYWIDMESGVRTDGWLDVAKCEAVCKAVYG